MKEVSLVLLTCCVIMNSSCFGAEPASGHQFEQKLQVDGASIPYLLYLPRQYGSTTTNWPLVLFLHGRGESDGPLSVVAKWGPPKIAARGEDLPFILASPQCPREDSWNRPSQQKLLAALLDRLQSSFRVDARRVYLTGLSMGGYGSWRLAADQPNRFAAVVPICGGGRPEDAERLKDLPIWVWHGTEDRAVPLQNSTKMVEAIKAAGGSKIRFTILEHVSHNSWEAAYATPEVFTWMLSQKRP